jgi:chromosome segregation ATPase
VEVPPDGTATLEVVERRTTTRHEDIEDVDEERLRAWREGKVIDGPSSDVLARAVALRREIERFEARRDEHGRRRTDLLERQKRIAGALEPLGATGDEAGLRSRYVASLQAVEDEIEQLDRADADVAVQREQLEAEILDLLRHGLA